MRLLLLVALFVPPSCVATNDAAGPRGERPVFPASFGSGASTESAGCRLLRSGGKAVSLTYDDNLSSQLERAVPDLESHGLRGTFFIEDVRSSEGPWRALRARGHELGSHTFGHPCPHSYGPWVLPGKGSEDYTLARMAAELDEATTMLSSLGQRPPFAFAYPCGVSWVGTNQTSYAPLVQARFIAARGVSSDVARAHAIDLDRTPGIFLTGTGTELVAKVTSAPAGAWVVFGFHGIDQETLPISRAAHAELLAYLRSQKDAVWVAPFGEVAACVAAR